VGDVWVGTVWACILIFVWLRGQLCVDEWCYEDVGSCEVEKVARCDFLLPRSLIKTCMCVCLCVYVCQTACLSICLSVCTKAERLLVAMSDMMNHRNSEMLTF